jgi:hypothetical protein
LIRALGGIDAASQEANLANSRSRARFKEPPALKRLNRSLDSAQEALTELRKDTRPDVSQGARDLYKDLRAFVSSARRDAGKLARALQRDFEQAQKQLDGGRAASGARSRASATRRQRAPRAAAKRSPAR